MENGRRGQRIGDELACGHTLLYKDLAKGSRKNKLYRWCTKCVSLKPPTPSEVKAKAKS
jgi:hypothetical protein